MARQFESTCGDVYDAAHIVPNEWSIDSGRGTVAIETSVSGATGNCLALAAPSAGGGNRDEYLRKNLPATFTRLICGFRFKMDRLPVSGKRCIAAFWDPLANLQTGLYVNADGSLALWQGGTTDAPSAQVGTNTAPNLVRAATWGYIELDETFAATATGAFTLRFNSQSVRTGTTLQTTTNGSGVSMFSIDSIGVGDNDPNNHYFDDVYVNDTSGSVNNTFDGDIAGLVFLPTAAGQYTQMSIGGTAPAATNWQSVNQSGPDDDTTLVSAAATGLKDTYKVAPLPANVTSIVCVTAIVDARTDTTGLAGGAQLAPVLGNGTTTVVGTSQSLNTSYAVITQHWGTNPITSAAWGTSDWSTIEVGQDRTA